MACCGGQRELAKRARGKAAWEEKIGKGKKWKEIENKDHALYERRVRGVCFERKCDGEIVRKKGKGLMEGTGGRNQSASHYLLSGALQQRDEIIKNPIAAL